MVYSKSKQSKMVSSRFTLSDEDTDSEINMNAMLSKKGTNLRACSSSPMIPSPVASSKFGSTNGLDLGFLSSSGSELSNSEDLAANKVFFTSGVDDNSTIQRERVRDRSLGRTSEKLYRKVNRYAANTIPIRGVNRPGKQRSRSVRPKPNQKFLSYNRRSKSMHGISSEQIIAKLLEREDRPEKQRSRSNRPKLSQKFISYNGRSKSVHGTSAERIIAKLLEREDRRFSVEYMHIVSSPLSSSEKHDGGSSDEAFYLGGPEYNAWCSKRSASSSCQLCATLNRKKVTGMFKSQLRPIRQMKGHEQIERSTAVRDKAESEKAEWGSGVLFLAAFHVSPSKSNATDLVPRQTFSRPNTVPRFTRSCFATPCRPRIDLARKVQSPTQVAAETVPKTKLLLTSFPTNTSSNSLASPVHNSKCSVNSLTADDNGITVNATNDHSAVRDHTKNMEVQLLVDGRSKAVSFPFHIKSSREKPVVQVVEVLLDGVSLWRRKQSMDARKEKGSSGASKK